MGQTLSSAAQWTSAHDGRRGLLEFSPVNELILTEIVDFVARLTSDHVEESRFLFRNPLVWRTEMKEADLYLGFHQSDGAVVSNGTDSRGNPVAVLRTKGLSSEFSVSSFEQLANIVRCTGSKKLHEARRCLEANPDPVVSILGDRFVTTDKSSDAAYRLTQEVIRVKDSASEEWSEAEAQEKKLKLNILLLIRDLDSRLMLQTIQTISHEIKLSPAEVDRAFEVLQRFSGSIPDSHVLKDVTWLEPFTFAFQNGCRAPFCRQLSGDIAYIVVTPHDSDPVYITASTLGYYVNQGLQQGTGDLNFNKESDYYKDLITLLRDKSPHFGQLITRQDILRADEKSPALMVPTPSQSKLRPKSSKLALRKPSPRSSLQHLHISSSNQLSVAKGDSIQPVRSSDKADVPLPLQVPSNPQERVSWIMSGEEAKKEQGRPPKKKKVPTATLR